MSPRAPVLPATSSRRSPAIVALVASLVAACGAPATNAPAKQGRTAETPLVPLTATVGSVAPPLTSGSPTTTPKGAVTETRCSQSGVAVVLLADTSGSMKGAPLDAVRAAALRIARDLRDDDMLEVVAYDSAPRRILPMSRASKIRSTLQATLAPMTAAGGTLLAPALEQAYQDLGTTAACEKHIVLITDSPGHTDGVRDIAVALASDGMTLSAIGLGSQEDTLALQSLTALAGGSYSTVYDVKTLPDLVASDLAGVEATARKREPQ